MHYYKFNIASWAKDTSHLSAKEEGVYLRLINYYYDTEKPIQLETNLVFRKLRLADESESAELILDEFFTKTKKGWVHNHCEKLISEYQKMSERNKKNAKLGGRPKNNNLTKPTGFQVDNQEVIDSDTKGIPNYKPLTNNQEPIKEVAKVRFDEFWNLYNKKSDRAKCEEKFKKLKQSDVEIIFSVLPAYIRDTPDVKFRKNPLTWLNGKCWLDEQTSKENPPSEKQLHYDIEEAKRKEIEEIKRGLL